MQIPRVLFILLAAVLFTGCAAYTKPRVAAGTFVARRAMSQRYTLGIERTGPVTDEVRHRKHFITGDDLIAAARRRGAFRQVDYVDRLPAAPDLVLRGFTYDTEFTLYEPLLYVLTVGVIPQNSPVSHPISYTVAKRNGKVLRQVDESRKDTILIGWIAGLVRFLPGWSPTADQPAHADSVLAKILEVLPG